ncbi:MAG: hypothetical protein JW841_17375 [Deltaproteobacteria bacterium]|nr:hypothetical protein [Deltaproteobacteria bacterium]
MASLTRIFMTKVRNKMRKMGHKRKSKLENQGSTPTRAAFFGDTKATKEVKA